MSQLQNGLPVAASGGVVMALGIKITWARSKPSVPYLRLLATLRHHGLAIAVPVFTQE